MIRGDRLGLRVGIFFERDAAGKPRRNFMFPRSGLGSRNGRAGYDFLALGKIHQKLSGDWLQQFAVVPEGHTMF